MDHRAQEAISLCRKLAEFTEEPGHTTRTFLSPSMRDVHRELGGRMEQRGMSVSVADAIRSFGLDPARLPEARLADNTLGYLEFHIEQGPVLESLSYPLGVVEAIAGQSRLKLCFTGKAGHAGTTSMRLRRDALAGAAQWIALVENLAQNTHGLVATVGRLEIGPNA